jgi:hypothetical protein
MNADFGVLCGEAIEVGLRTIRSDDHQSRIACGACVHGLSLAKQKSASAGGGFEVSAEVHIFTSILHIRFSWREGQASGT